MAELRPYPIAALARRIVHELESSDSLFDVLPRSKLILDPGGPGGQSGPDRPSGPGGPGRPDRRDGANRQAGRDLSVRFHGQRASTPLGPAAGPHTQLAQNIVLAWLAGCRIIELKTVQVRDALTIARPCIDMQTVGFNIEWSQELRLAESLEEYVKASMLIELTRALGNATGLLPMSDQFSDVVFDMSVGYDLAGIQSEPVERFIDGMIDAGAVVERLRRQLPAELGPYRDLDFTTRIARSLTLSTFHGCPPDEIERIALHLMERKGLHCTIKLNPTLLGEARVHELLHEHLGYTDLHVPRSAFARDTSWNGAMELVGRLSARARDLGLGLGVKLTNTLVVENPRTKPPGFLPASEPERYLSGPPLHVLAMSLVERFRQELGARYPISFSAGIDAHNFADAVALGLVPVTVCTDLLKPGGYGRAGAYLTNLMARMDALGARDIPSYILHAHGRAADALERLDMPAEDRARCAAALARGGDVAAAAGARYADWVAEASLLNTACYLEQLLDDPRYARASTSKPPRKLDRHLALFDCIDCHKCVPVCPNHAVFVFTLPWQEIPRITVRPDPDHAQQWIAEQHGMLRITRARQYGTFADFCNDCGNCDVFCPEHGGPYRVKPRFFGHVADWRRFAPLDGFTMTHHDGQDILVARLDGREMCLGQRGPRALLSGPGFELELDPAEPTRSLSGHAAGPVDLTYFHILCWIRDAVYGPDQHNYASLLARRGGHDAP